MEKIPIKKNTFYPKNRKAWRGWLQKNHEKEKEVWIIYYKKHSVKPTISYNDAVEEALCFGWIDSRANKIDEDCYMQVFNPRRRKSNWSKLNKERIEKLVANGLMTAIGLEKIELAKKDGSWNKLDDVYAMVIPPDLKKAFATNKKAWKNFDAFSPSSKRGILSWIESAKRPETRQKRIDQTVKSA